MMAVNEMSLYRCHCCRFRHRHRRWNNLSYSFPISLSPIRNSFCNCFVFELIKWWISLEFSQFSFKSLIAGFQLYRVVEQFSVWLKNENSKTTIIFLCQTVKHLFFSLLFFQRIKWNRYILLIWLKYFRRLRIKLRCIRYAYV